MAVAMEIGWGGGCSSPNFCMSKKRGWGQDQQKLLQLMIGQPSSCLDHHQATTLDLLGGSCSSSSTSSEEILEELDMDLPPPKGWEKRLDLKLGKFYYVDLTTGKSTYEHPRKLVSSSGGNRWDLQSELDKIDMKELLSGRQESDDLLELKLNSSSSSASASNIKNRGISTIQAVQDALKRSSSSSTKRRGSTSASSTTSSSSKGANCQSSASEKSTSSKYRGNQHNHGVKHQVLAVNEVQVQPKVVLTGCKRCLMYVMLTQSDPRCPKCGSSLGISEMPLHHNKKPRLELDLL